MQLFPEVGGSGDAPEVVMHDSYRKVTFGRCSKLHLDNLFITLQETLRA